MNCADVPESKRAYFDSSVYLAFLNGEPGRATVVASLVEEAERGNIALFTSTIALAEVAFIRNFGSERDIREYDSQIDSLLQNPRITTLVQFTPAIGVRAREFVRSEPGRRARLTVLDAIHLSSAAAATVDAFYAYDRDFQPFEAAVDFTISEPVAANPRMNL